MIRQALIERQEQRQAQEETGSVTFRLRDRNVSRLEGLSDAVFGFAITLLAISLETPKTFNALVASFQGVTAFGISFFLLFRLWHTQYTFFRRYGVQDDFAVWINAALLFVVILYIYPMKFLFLLFTGAVRTEMTLTEFSWLFALYGAGYGFVYLLFTLLHIHAYRLRQHLELNALETLDTIDSLGDNAIHTATGTLIFLVCWLLPPRIAPYAGIVAFTLLGVAMTVFKSVMGKGRRTLRETHQNGEISDTVSKEMA